MTIQRSTGFYHLGTFGVDNFDWRKSFSVKELRKQHKDWEFKEVPDGYRFINPQRTLIKYYQNDGNVFTRPMNVIYDYHEEE